MTAGIRGTGRTHGGSRGGCPCPACTDAYNARRRRATQRRNRAAGANEQCWWCNSVFMTTRALRSHEWHAHEKARAR